MKKEIFIISFVRMLSAAGFVISVPFLNIFLYNERGIPMKVVGLYLTLASLAGAFSRIYSGRLSDRFSSTTIMNMGLISRIFAFIGFSILVSFHSPVFLFFFAFMLNSLGFSFFGTASDTYVGESINKRERPRAYGILRIGANVGWAAGPAFGGFLANISYFLLFLLSTFLAILGLFLNKTFVQKDKIPLRGKGKTIHFKKVFEDRNFLIFLIGSFLIFVLVGQLISSLPVFARHSGLDNLQVGYLFSVNGLMVVVFQYPITVVLKRISNKKGLILGAFLYFLGYLFFARAISFSNFVIGVVILTLGEMIVMPLVTTTTTIIAPRAIQGTYLGLLGFMQGLGWALSPLIGGIFIDAFVETPLYLWLAISSFAILAILFYLKVKKLDKI